MSLLPLCIGDCLWHFSAAHCELLSFLQVAQQPGADQFAHALARLAATVAGDQASKPQIAAAAALADLLAAQLVQVWKWYTDSSITRVTNMISP